MVSQFTFRLLVSIILFCIFLINCSTASATQKNVDLSASQVITPVPTSGTLVLPKSQPQPPLQTTGPPEIKQQPKHVTTSDLNPSESKTKRSYGPKGYDENENHYREIGNDLIEEDLHVKHESNSGHSDGLMKGALLDKGKAGLASADKAKHDLDQASGIANLDQKIHKDHDKYVKHSWNRGDGFVKRWSWDQGTHLEKEKDEGDKKHTEQHGKKVHHEHHEIDKAAVKEMEKQNEGHKMAHDSGSSRQNGNLKNSGFYLEDYNFKDKHRKQSEKRKRKEKQPKKYRGQNYDEDEERFQTPYDFAMQGFKVAKADPHRDHYGGKRNQRYRPARQPRRPPSRGPPPPPPPPPPPSPDSRLEDSYERKFESIKPPGRKNDDFDDDNSHGPDSSYFIPQNGPHDDMPQNLGYISSKHRENEPPMKSEYRKPSHSSKGPIIHRHRQSKPKKSHSQREPSSNWRSVSRQEQESKKRPYRRERIVKYIDEYDNDLHPDVEPPKEPKYTDYPYPAEDETAKPDKQFGQRKLGKKNSHHTHRHHRVQRQYYLDDSQRSPSIDSTQHHLESRNHFQVHNNITDGSSLLSKISPQQFQTILDNEFSRTGYLGMGHIFGYASEIPPIRKFMPEK